MRNAALWIAAAISLIAMHEAQSAEKPLTKVAVIDSGLDLNDPRFHDVLCKSGHRDFTATSIEDTHGHGTHVAGLIMAKAGHARYCLLILKYYLEKSSGRVNLGREVSAIRYAIEQKATIINFSGGGPEFNEDEYLAIKSNPTVKFLVAAGNEGKSVTEPGDAYYPAAINLPNVIVVGNGTSEKDRDKSSNFGPRINAWEDGRFILSSAPGNCPSMLATWPVEAQPMLKRMVSSSPDLKVLDGCTAYMTGTSQATAIHTGKLLSK